MVAGRVERRRMKLLKDIVLIVVSEGLLRNVWSPPRLEADER
jgi:hypothetical protein